MSNMSTSSTQRYSKAAIFAALPQAWKEDLLPKIQEELKGAKNHKLIVLDDDPTGTQTVKNIPVITDWEVATLVDELKSNSAGFFILTNSRSLTECQTKELHRKIAVNIALAVLKTGKTFTLISRSDSTLRGHYPLETDVLSDLLGPFDILILAPYFEAGGRYTIDDTHYVAEGDLLVPASETPFARDRAFGYKNSNLPLWVEEKTEGRISASEVVSLSLEQVRTNGPEALSKQLLNLPSGTVCVANAACPEDIECLALASLLAEKNGIRIAFRSAASIVSARLGQRPQSPLRPEELLIPNCTQGGLTIVGSYVPKTTAQLESLKSQATLTKIEIQVDQLLEASTREQTIDDAIQRMNTALSKKEDVVIYTSRKLVEGSNATNSLAIGNVVSDALVNLTLGLEKSPRYLIAKGGITSSDIATKGLGIRRANVTGQALPGVPVWQLGAETRFAGMNYVVFPGNVGSDEALGQLVSNLQNTTL